MKRLITTTAIAVTAMTSAAFAQQAIDLDGIAAEGNNLAIPSVTADQPGYLVLHETENGEPVVPQSIGHAPVAEGENTNVQISADTPLRAGNVYIMMLHEETNGNDTYDFGPGSTEVDTPVMVEGAPLVNDFRAVSASQQGSMEEDGSAMEGGAAMEGDAMQGEAMESDTDGNM